MTYYKVAILGTGDIAGAHLRALQAMGDRVQVVAAMDVDRERVSSFRARHGSLRAYQDVGSLLAEEQPDLVHIATPPGTHCDLIVQSLKAGAWVWCEKPLCVSLRELDSIAAAEQESGSHCSSVCQWRFGSGARHLKTLIESGSLGRPLVGTCLTTWYRDMKYFQAPWRSHWATAGGGPSMGHGIHLMDFFLWLFGDREEVCAMVGTLDRPVEVEDVSMAIVRFSKGAMGSMVNSLLSPRQETHLRLDFQRATVEVTGLYGYTNESWRYTMLESTVDGPTRADPAQIPNERPATHESQLTDLLDSMDRGERPAASTVDVRTTIEFISCLYKSAATGRTVRRGTIGPDDAYYDHVAGQAPDTTALGG